MQDDRLARMALSALSEPDDKTLARAVAEHGAAATFERVCAGAGSLVRFAGRLAALDVERLAHMAQALGARILIPGDDEWPVGLDDLAAPPHCLWVRGKGSLHSTSTSGIAIVGSRLATPYGAGQTYEIAADLAARGYPVVSGAAKGIDAAAHRGALAGRGVTHAVLACGVDRVYPAEHADLLARIMESGTVVTEAAPGRAPTRSRFVMRNRLIATMTRGTFVAEADLRSGSLNTARHALEHSREVAVLPGPVTSMLSSGCHQLIRERGAILVTDAQEVLDALTPIGLEMAPRQSGETRAHDHLDPDTARVHEHIPYRKPITVEALADVAGVSLGQVWAAVGVLELEGLIVAREGGWTKAPTRRA